MNRFKNADGSFGGRKPKHSELEIQAINGRWVMGIHGLEYLPGYSSAQLRRRSHNRMRNKLAIASRRRNRH